MIEQSPPGDLSLQHLQVELMRLDMLIHRLVRRRQSEEAADGKPVFPGYFISQTQAYALLQRPFGRPAAGGDDEAESYEAALAQSAELSAALAAQAAEQGQPARLEQLAALFELDPFERDALLVAVAPALDLRYQSLYGYLHDDVTRKRPSVNLILDLLCPPGPGRLAKLPYFAPEAPLLRFGLLEPAGEAGGERPFLLNQAMSPADGIVDWLLGQYRPHREVAPYVTLIARPAAAEALLPPAALPLLVRAADSQALLALSGPDELSRQMAAEVVAEKAGRPLLSLDLAGAVESGLAPQPAARLALRDARLMGAVPYLTGWQRCLQDGAPPAGLLALLCRHPGTLLIGSRVAWQAQQLEQRRRLVWLSLPLPDYRQRQMLLNHFLGPEGEQGALDTAGVAGQFALTSGQLRDLVDTARDRAWQDGRALETADLYAAARAHSNPRLASLARKITPRYGWDDLILPGDQITILREMVDTVRSRPLVLGRWGVGRKLAASAGVTALFAGPPGTGKTMGAEVIAGELGLDLYKIDLSSMVSKYIGETEKNLERIFNEAESSNAILFFDEADAIFGKRSEVKDAHDRYANIEVSYLLQRMEAYDGVTILATNLRANLDEAFMRRLQFAVDFPFPEAADRLRIWQTLFPPEVPHEADLDLERLARSFKLAGGNIRNIIVSAAYLAATNGQVVTMEHLLHGTRRELQKMGRLVDDEQLTVHD